MEEGERWKVEDLTFTLYLVPSPRGKKRNSRKNAPELCGIP
jgi:hypothetical protein